MFSSDQLNNLAQEVMNSLKTENKEIFPEGQENNNNKLKLTTTQTLAILALLAGTMDVTSVVIDRDQNLQLVLSGTLRKEEESELEKIMGQIGNAPFDEVMKAMLKRFR